MTSQIVAKFRKHLEQKGKGSDWTDAQLEKAIKVMKEDRSRTDADNTPGRMMIDEKTWIEVWHDRDAEGNKYEHFGIAVGPPNAPERGSSIQFARTDLVLQFAAMRAPYGSGPPGSGTRFSVQGGKPEGYLKGQFIPGGVIDNLKKSAASGNTAAKQQVAELEKGHAASQATQQKNVETRRQRDISQLKGRLAAHAEGQNVPPSPQAVRGYRALRAAHGDLVLHRLDELSEHVQDRIDRTKKNLQKLPRGTEARATLLQTLDRLQGEMGRLHQIHQLAEASGLSAPQTAPQTQQTQQASENPATQPIPPSAPEKPSPEVVSELSKLGSFRFRDDGALMGTIDRSLPPEARADLRSFAEIINGNDEMSYLDRARAFAQRQDDWRNKGRAAASEQETSETKGLPPAHPNANEVYNINTASLEVAPGLFQYKISDIDPETGTTQELRSVRTWNPNLAGVVSVWRDPATGRDYVVNGHHRYELAHRLGVGDLSVRYIQAADAKEARAIGAQINIAEGRGTAIDAAKYMRDMGVTPEEMERDGISLQGRTAADGVVLSKLSDRAFQQLTQGTLDQKQALAVATHLADPEKQDILFAKLQKKEEAGKTTPSGEVEEMAREMALSPTTKQMDLFGEVENPLFDERAKVRNFIRNDFGKKYNDYSAVASKRRAKEVSGAGNVLNTEENQRLKEKAGEDINVFDREAYLKGPVSDAINQAAVELSQAKTKEEKNAILKRAAKTISDAGNRGPVFGGGVGQSGQSQPNQPANATDAGTETASAGGGSETHPPEPAAETAPVSADQRRGDTGEAGLSETPAGQQPQGPQKSSEPPTPSTHPPEKIQAALDRYEDRGQTAQGGGIFGGEDLQSREGFSKLPDKAPVVFTSGEFQGKTGKIVHDTDPSTGKPRIVAEVDGRPGLVPVTPDAIEPLDKNLSWRTEGGGAGAVHKQGGLFTADQFLPRREKAQDQANSGEPTPESPKEQPENKTETPAPAKPTEEPSAERRTPTAASETSHPLLSHLSAKKPRSLKKIAERAGIDKAEAAKQLKQLIKDGRVKIESGEDGDRYVLNPEKQSVTAPPAKVPPERPAAPATKPQPPSRTPPPPKPPAPATPAPPPSPRKLTTNPAEIRKQAEAYRTSPEYLSDLERLADMNERRGDTAGAQSYRERAGKLRDWLKEHNRLAEDFGYNPGVHEREKPAAHEGVSRLADVMAGKKHAPEPERPIVMQALSPQARKVVEEEQKVEGGKERGRGRPGKNKILNAAKQLSQMKTQLASKNPALDTTPEPDEENSNPEPVTMRQRLQKLADETERAIASRDMAALKKLRFQRMQFEAVLQFMRTGSLAFAG